MGIEERALAWAFGALSAEERASVARERLHHRALDEEIALVEQLLSGLRLDCAPFFADHDAWRRLTHALEREHRALADSRTEACAEGRWQVYRPGIEFKPLWRKAMLIRCDPGASEEAHDQPEEDDEHILVLAGDLDVGGRCFGTGDYLRLPAGSVHMRMRTQGGCVLFSAYQAKAG
jgi:hypothetical protein